MSECSGPGCKHSSHQFEAKPLSPDRAREFYDDMKSGKMSGASAEIGGEYLSWFRGGFTEDLTLPPEPEVALTGEDIAKVAGRIHREEMAKIARGERRPSILDEVAECGCHRRGDFMPDWNPPPLRIAGKLK